MKKAAFFKVALLSGFTCMMFACKDSNSQTETGTDQYGTESGMSGDTDATSPGSNMDNTSGSGMAGDTLTTGGTGTGGTGTGTGGTGTGTGGGTGGTGTGGTGTGIGTGGGTGGTGTGGTGGGTGTGGM